MTTLLQTNSFSIPLSISVFTTISGNIMFILSEYQGKGIAQKAITLVEEMFPKAISWELATILEEKRNCYLYEKMGYKKTGVKKKLNENATLIFYKKVVRNFSPLSALLVNNNQ